MRRRDLCLWLILLAQAFSASAQVFNVEKERVQLAEINSPRPRGSSDRVLTFSRINGLVP
jgi:hypothetical protein